MKKQFFTALCSLLVSGTALHMSAQIPFSMAEEEVGKNTPEGWTAVDLPKNLPTFTTSNTFYINAAPYNASTESADNTTAIQAALNAAANAGGGMVVIPAGTWLCGSLQMGSKTVLHLCDGATLKLLAHDTFPKDGNGYAKMENPFITGKSGASDIVIEGESRSTSIIDGQGAPWWDDVETAKTAGKSTTRSALIRFWQGQRYLFRNFRIQNAPNTNITIGRNGSGKHNTAHDITIKNPASSGVEDPSHNTDGFPIWTQYVNIYNCEIDTGDDNVVTDQDAQYVHVWNCLMKAGHGTSLGSYTTNMHDILYEDLTFEGTGCGFRLKSNRDRSGDVYNITFRNCTMTGVETPIQITAWYDTLPESPQAAAASPSDLISTTPKYHDILIQNVTATNPPTYTVNPKNGYCVMIYGRPESLVKDVTFDNVKVTNNKGLKMNFCEGVKFINGCTMTNQKTGVSSTETSVAQLIEEGYRCDYTWNGYSPEDITIVTLDATTTTSKKDAESPYTFNNGYTISNGGNKKYASGNGNTIKYSRDVQYTISGLPADKAIYSVSFRGYSNVDDGDCYLAEVNGQTYDADTYIYGNRKTLNDPSKYVTHTINFDTPVTGDLTFTPGQNQACFIISLDVRKTGGTGISTMPMDKGQETKNNVTYDLQGRQVAQLQKGLYIINGKKVMIK